MDLAFPDIPMKSSRGQVKLLRNWPLSILPAGLKSLAKMESQKNATLFFDSPIAFSADRRAEKANCADCISRLFDRH